MGTIPSCSCARKDDILRKQIFEENESAKPSPITPLLPRNGITIKQALKIQFESALDSARNGDLDSMIVVGIHLTKGKAEIHNEEEGVEWFTKAAKEGSLEAMFHLGFWNEKANGEKKSYSQAWEWYLKAANQGHGRSQTRLGLFCERGYLGSKNREEAFKWYSRAAENRDFDPEGAYFLGSCYMKGIGTQKDPEKGAHWFKESADEKFPAGICNLGFCYEQGIGVKRDLKLATQCYIDAASTGNPTAIFRLGLLYEFGTVLDKDLVKAKLLYLQAQQKGHKGAAERLENLKHVVVETNAQTSSKQTNLNSPFTRVSHSSTEEGHGLFEDE
jgi:TPR repeat protein